MLMIEFWEGVRETNSRCLLCKHDVTDCPE